MKSKESVSVLGLGNWGTALAQHLFAKGHDVLGWSIESRIVQGINSDRKNPSCLQDVTLGFKATGDLAEAAARSIIILVVPSSALKEISQKLTPKSSSVLVSAIKGFETETCMTPLQYLEERIKAPLSYGVLSGPSFAKDVVQGRPCGVVAASRDETTARRIAELFSSESMKVYVSLDPLGVELGGAVKNVIALAAGLSDGLGFGESARAGLITRGLAEIMRLAEAMGAKRETLAGLSGLGDLSMTASSPTSRNYTVGFRLGKGEKLSDILFDLGSVAEGVHTAPIVMKLALRYSVEVPICEQVNQLLLGKSTPKELVRNLMARPLRSEF